MCSSIVQWNSVILTSPINPSFTLRMKVLDICDNLLLFWYIIIWEKKFVLFSLHIPISNVSLYFKASLKLLHGLYLLVCVCIRESSLLYYHAYYSNLFFYANSIWKCLYNREILNIEFIFVETRCIAYYLQRQPPDTFLQVQELVLVHLYVICRNPF